MMRKINVVQEGDTDLLPGHEISLQEFKDASAKALKAGGKLPVGKPLLLGITKAALASDSFLSASSFQETTRILTAAAIQSKSDSLIGLKENVIIGGLIPAGTGILVEDTFECEHRPEDENSIYEDVMDSVHNDDELIDDNDLDDDVLDDDDSNFIDEEELSEE